MEFNPQKKFQVLLMVYNSLTILWVLFQKQYKMNCKIQQVKKFNKEKNNLYFQKLHIVKVNQTLYMIKLVLKILHKEILIFCKICNKLTKLWLILKREIGH